MNVAKVYIYQGDEKKYIIILLTTPEGTVLLQCCLLLYSAQANGTARALQRRIQDFKLGGAHLKKLRRAEGGANIFGVFRVKNHDFTPKIIFFSIAVGGAKIFGVFRVKNHDFPPKNLIFSNFRWGARRVRPPESAPALYLTRQHYKTTVLEGENNNMFSR